jgi:hypothetical protein
VFLIDGCGCQSNENVSNMVASVRLQLFSSQLLLRETRGCIIRFNASYLRGGKQILNPCNECPQQVSCHSPAHLQ